MERARALLDFWFGGPGDPERYHHRQIWFRSTPEFDAAVRERFAADHERAAAGELASWEAAPETALALVMLLDQVPRNIFRACRALSPPIRWRWRRPTGDRARLRPAVPDALAPVLLPAAGAQRGLGKPAPRARPAAGLAADTGPPDGLHMTRRHLEIIEQFGRFPHRNPILGRQSTEAEIAFLAEQASIWISDSSF